MNTKYFNSVQNFSETELKRYPELSSVILLNGLLSEYNNFHYILSTVESLNIENRSKK